MRRLFGNRFLLATHNGHLPVLNAPLYVSVRPSVRPPALPGGAVHFYPVSAGVLELLPLHDARLCPGAHVYIAQGKAFHFCLSL